jgi:hypothetical protein
MAIVILSGTATFRMEARYHIRRSHGFRKMTKDTTDLRNGLPGHTDAPLGADDLDRTDDAPVAREPEVVSPEIGKNVPSGQTTKG